LAKFVGGDQLMMDWSADLGLLTGVKKGFGTRERVPSFSGIEFVSESEEVELEAGFSRTVMAPVLSMLTVMSPSLRKGRREWKGGGLQRRRGFIDD
jgi:hypothetical protein